ncbi:MAG: sigma-70 family RNA polymerase sigma factor [Actinomycetota bacterium]
MGQISGEQIEPARAIEFDAFFEREALGQLRRTVLLLGSEADAGDVVQEAFARLWERWDRLDEPGPYLNRTVLNLCRDHARRARRHRGVLARLDRRPETTEHSELLDDVLAGLPFNQRAAIVLRYWAGMTNDEIAHELGCAPGSVGPWIRRALDTMGKELR